MHTGQPCPEGGKKEEGGRIESFAHKREEASIYVYNKNEKNKRNDWFIYPVMTLEHHSFEYFFILYSWTDS